MAGAEKLIEKIQNDAQRDAEQFWRETEAKKTIMRTTVIRDIEKRKAEIEKLTQDAIQEKKKRMSSVYDLEYRKQLLAAKQEMMQEAKSLVLKKLSTISNDEYLALMKDRLLQCAITGEGSIAISKSDTRLGGAFLADVNQTLQTTLGKGNVSFTPEKQEIAGGFVYNHGGMEINISLEALLNEAWQETETDIARVLFEQPNK